MGEIESLESWLNNKPYWEQFVWELCLDKAKLDDADVEHCYELLIQSISSDVPDSRKIDFSNKNLPIPLESKEISKIILKEIKEPVNINALPQNLSFKMSPNLTVLYGENGTGKSGIGRLLCNACFSRGEREILPNLLENETTSGQQKAKFVIQENSELKEIDYVYGSIIKQLKSFSVFDKKSVLIHLDDSNKIYFTPPQVKVFDKVAEVISSIEKKLNNEKEKRRVDNPFSLLFSSVEMESDISAYCKTVSSNTDIEDYKSKINFNLEIDQNRINELEKLISAKKKLDITEKKKLIEDDVENLNILKSTLQRVLESITVDTYQEINDLNQSIKSKKEDINKIALKDFDTSTYRTIGTAEWKTLIETAKILYEKEKEKNSNKELDTCILCHQNLSGEAVQLFHKYWNFLSSTAEAELKELLITHNRLLNEMKAVLHDYPKLQSVDAGVKILQTEQPEVLLRLRSEYSTLKDTIEEYVKKLENIEQLSENIFKENDITCIQELIDAKNKEKEELVDPSSEIESLTSELNVLQHKKSATAIQEKAIDYINYLKWISKVNRISFAGIKQVLTRKKTEYFKIDLLTKYKKIINEELEKLGCKYNLVIGVSGELGDTKKELRLKFAEDYEPSHILSEGEQNICSLADFLTEIQLDESNCGIIFDDPVTSLDHLRKDDIALRLVNESARRQVIILTHDIMFLSKLLRYAYEQKISFQTHWMRKVEGMPGCIEENTTPKLANLKSIKEEYSNNLKEFESADIKQQERLLVCMFDDLRRACEALIEERLFNKTIQRYDDHIKVQNLEEAVFDKDLALRLVKLHGDISEKAYMHHVSDYKREKPLSIEDFQCLQTQLEGIEELLNSARSSSRKEREVRKKTDVTNLV